MGGVFVVRTKRWTSIAVAVGTIAGVAALPATTAQAAATAYNIQVGGDAGVAGVGFEGMRFLAPGPLMVHKGDTITFTIAGFHTATLLPAGQGADDWVQNNATGPAGPTSTYSPIVLDADDATNPPTLMFNNNVAFPSDPTCGTATAPCDYTGKDVVNSGLPQTSNTFTVTVDAQPGDSFWVVCLIHSMMRLRVDVVADATAATTQTAIDSYKSQTLAADHEEAAALVPKLQQQTSHKTSSGTVVDAYAGYDGDGWGLDAMFPTKIHIKKGQTVRWHFAQLTHNIHSVTFPRSTANTYATVDYGGQNVHCEGANGGPDTAPDAPPPTFCSSGPQNFEAEVRGAAALRMGSGKYNGTGYHSSGVEGMEAGTVAPYDLKFTKVKTKHGGWKYACVVHGSMMTGHVYVKAK